MYVEDKWLFDFPNNSFIHVKRHERTEAFQTSKEDIDIVIPYYFIHSLIDFLREEGYIKPIMNNESREEDLKIVHRLIDLMERSKD